MSEPKKQETKQDEKPIKVRTLRNLHANPISVLGLSPHGECEYTDAMQADKRTAQKVARMIELGIIEVI